MPWPFRKNNAPPPAPEPVAPTLSGPELLARVRRVHLRTSRVVDALFAGRWRSAFRGRGMEFEEVREYAPGDEVRDIDWKVTARMRRPFVRLYREERELTILLLVDASASGRFGTGGASKWERAVETAAVLAFSAVRGGDRVGLALFSDRVDRYLPPRKGSGHVWRIIREMAAAPGEGRGTDLAGALAFLGRAVPKRCVVFVLSDFQAPDFARDLKVLARRHEVVALELTDPADPLLPDAPFVALADPETGETLVLDAHGPGVREAYARAREAARQRLETLCRECRVDRVELSTGADPAAVLAGFFRLREARR